MPREYSVSEDVLKIISTFFVDGCYVFQVVEKFMEMHPELTIKQARVKADKSMRFLERKGLLWLFAFNLPCKCNSSLPLVAYLSYH
ncbi:hypothetical protein [Alishewanella sp. HL-SH06]|uniref:hypothetical protein n=1 Tax=Alishewanella sp. HL-SH06 TaxID=3461144 RepID=UPI0040431F6F